MSRIALVLSLLAVCLIVTTSTVTPGPLGRTTGGPFVAPAINVVWPTEWGGVWTGQSRSYICETPPPAWEASEETICGGTFIDAGDVNDMTWEVRTLNSVTVDVTASATVELYTDCFQTTTVDMDFSRNGESMTGTVIVNTFTAGTGAGCNQIPANCLHTDIQADRTAPEPATCVAAVESSTWGHVKAIYE